MSHLSPPPLKVDSSPQSSSTSPTGAAATAPAIQTNGEMLLPPAVAITHEPGHTPNTVQSARGPAPLRHTSSSSEDASNPTNRRAAAPPAPATTTAATSPQAPWDWPGPPPQTQRAASSGSSSGGAGYSVSPLPYSSSSPLLHSLPANESLYMQGMLTKKGRNLGFGLGFWRTTRLYMLTDTALSCTDKTRKDVKNYFLVESFKSVSRMQSRRWPNRCFTLLLEDGKVFHLRAPTVPECTDWMDAISKAILNADKRKARWRFMRDNAQMQQMQQMAQMGQQVAYGPLPLQQQIAIQQQAALIQQQQQLDLLGMMPMPVSPGTIPISLHPMQVAQMQQSMQMAQLGYPMPLPYVPTASVVSPFAPLIGDPNLVAGGDSSLPTSLQRLKSRDRSRSNGVGKDGASLTRTDSKSKSRQLAAQVAAQQQAEKNGRPTGGLSSSSDVGLTTDDSELDEATDVDEQEYYDESTEEYYQAPPAGVRPFGYDPFAAAAAAQQQAAAFAAWQQSQAALLYDPLQPYTIGGVLTDDQRSLNSQKDKLRWMFWVFTFVSAMILASGNQATTSREIAVTFFNANPTVGSSDITNAAAMQTANLTSISSTAAASLPFVQSLFGYLSGHLSLLLLLVSLFFSLYYGMKFKKHKKSMKQRVAEAKKLKLQEKAAGKPQPSNEEQQAKWKEESKILQAELAKKDRLMYRLGAAAATTIATAAYIYQAQ